MSWLRRKTSLPSTGHPGDDRLLQRIAQQSSLTARRHWLHYLYFPDEPSARSAAEVIRRAGWDLHEVDVAADGSESWVVIAEKQAAVTDAESVRAARTFFEGVAASAPGGEYDGWEASL